MFSLVVAGRAAVAVGRRVRQAAVALRAALPVELHLDPVVAVGVDGRAGGADHDGGLLAVDGRARMQQAAVLVGAAGAVGQLAADGVNAVAVQRPLADALADRVQAGAFLLAEQGVEQALAEALHQSRSELGAEVVVHQVDRAHHQEAALVVAAGQVELRLASEREGGAGGQRAHGAGADVDFARGLQRLQLVVGDALALFARLVGVGAGGVAAEQRGAVAGIGAGSADRAGVERTVIPAAEFDGIGLQPQLGAPAVQAVLLHGGAGLGVGDARLLVRLEAAVVVGDHHGMAAQAGAGGVAAVLEVIKQAFFVHQARGEGQVAFLVLGADAAFRVHIGRQDVIAPGRRQFALALVCLEDGVEDVEHGHVLEDPAIAPVRQKGAPGFDGQMVARQAAIRSRHLDRGNVTVERAQRIAAGRGQQFQQQRLADQGLELDRGIGRQRRDLELETLIETLFTAHAFSQQDVVAQWGAQPEQAGGLGKAGQQGGQTAWR